MTQTELNQKFAEVYGVNVECAEILNNPNIMGFTFKENIIPINADTLTLFQLCIEHKVNVMQNEYQVVCIFSGDNFINEHWYEEYKDHSTKESATCAAMFEALCKLKNIGE